MTVDIICSVLNGEQYLGAFLESLHKQTHKKWRLWFRDDGSSDKTVAILTAAAAQDSRIVLLHTGGPTLGVAGGFGWLLERMPADGTHVMCADCDDWWQPEKIERTLGAMRLAESEGTGPVLVHTDLTVADTNLAMVHQSFWKHAGIDPSRNSLREIVVSNVVTAPTMMMNRALRVLIGATPPEPKFQDWWYALVASAFGRIVALPESYILYRQHASNVVLGKKRRLREDLAHATGQAGAFLRCYKEQLSPEQRRFLAEYERLPKLPFLSRKLEVMRLHRWPGQSLVKRLGIVLRA